MRSRKVLELGVPSCHTSRRDKNACRWEKTNKYLVRSIDINSALGIVHTASARTFFLTVFVCYFRENDGSDHGRLTPPPFPLLAPPVYPPQRILEEQRRQDEKRRVKRAANRKSASTSRARKKAFVDDMTAKNERMKQHALILSMLPDLVLAVCRSGEMTYVSPACQWLLQHSPEEITGANVFEMVTHDCHALLRKMISDNLSRPVHSQTAAAEDSRETDGSDDDADLSDDEGSTRDRPTCREKVVNHRKGRHQYRQQLSPASGSSEGPRAKAVQAANSASQGPKMLKLIRRDKTTVWCESRLSVRTAKRDGGAAPIPLEIILTLRTVSEGTKTTMAHEFVGARIPAVESVPSERAVDADDYVEADDDGYQCEVDEEDSNNSGSGNDSGTTRNGHIALSTSGSIGCGGGGGGGASNKKRAEVEPDTEPVSDPMEGREERSLSKKRQRVRISNRMEDMLSAASGGSPDKSEGDGGFSRGTDTSGSTTGSTTQESSASGSNEADSNGEGSNNGSSKWGDGCGGAARFNSGSPCNGSGGSEDGGSSDGTSAEGTDFGDEVQSAVQSLILMGGDFSKGAQ